MMTTARDALAVRLAAAAGVADGERTEELERLVTQLFEELGRPVLRYIRGFESLDDEDPITDNPFFDQPFATDVFNYWRGTLGLAFRW